MVRIKVNAFSHLSNGENGADNYRGEKDCRNTRFK